MYKEMAELKGKYVFGSNWKLPVHFGLLTKKEVMDKKNDESYSPIAFLQNYESVWVGADEDAMVNMDVIQSLRNTSLKPILNNEKDEIYIAMDVARSQSKANNQSAYVIGRVIRSKTTNKIINVEIINIIVPENGMDFAKQTILLKRLQTMYNAKKVIIDNSGLGKAIVDEALHENYDKESNVTYPCWDCMNLELEPDVKGAEKLIYALNASGINNDIVYNFWDYLDTGRVSFLTSERNAEFSSKTSDYERMKLMIAYMNTDKLVDQLSNLKAIIPKDNSSKAINVKQVTKKVDKDIYSALVYLLYYIQNFENSIKKTRTNSFRDAFRYN